MSLVKTLLKLFKNNSKSNINSNYHSCLDCESRIKQYIDSRLTNHLLRSPLYFANSDRIFIHTSEGFRLFLDANDLHLSLHVIENGIWEGCIKKILEEILVSDSVFVDIGANIGITSLYASSYNPQGRVFCFEAVPKTFDILHSNIELNGLLERVKIENKAVSSTSGKIDFEYFSSHAGMSGIKVMDERLLNFKGKKQRLEVESVSLDDYFPVNTKIDLIKIDVEGFEFEVLKGASRVITENCNIKIIIEYYPENIKSVLGAEAIENFLNYVKSQKFKIFIIDNKKGKTIINYDELEKQSQNPSFGANLLMYR